jgi:pyrophosphatase PpaX
MEKKLRAVVFDLDGTLLNSIPLIRRTFEQVFAEFGIPWGDGAVMKTVGLPLRQAAEIYARGRDEQFLEAYATFYHDHQPEMLDLFPGTLDAVRVLHDSGYRLGLATSKRREPAVDGLILTGLDRYFTHVVAMDDTKRPKPYPDCLLRCLDLLAEDASRAIYVGDSIYDVQTGKNAGTATAGVTWGIASREELGHYRPDVIVDNWMQLLEALDRMNMPSGAVWSSDVNPGLAT